MLPLDPDKSASSGDVTLLLSAWIEGDQRALDSLVPLVYSELHRIARNHWSRQPAGHTLQPTAIVNEAFLRLMSFSGARDEDANSANPKLKSGFRDRSHFYAVASMAMRQILVNHARAGLASKRGGDRHRVYPRACGREHAYGSGKCARPARRAYGASEAG